MTTHWIDESDTKNPRKSAVLHSSVFPGSHTAENIAEKFSSMLGKWEISTDRCHMTITDNAANITKGVSLAGLTSGSCFIHTIQLAINDSVFSQRSVKDMIARSKQIVGHFNHSSLACSRLKEIQQELGLPQKKLIQDVATRWNSTYYLLERLLEMKRAVVLYSTENNIVVLSANEWTLVDRVLRLLQPFEEYTKVMSANNSCISEVLPAVTVLKRYLSKDYGQKTSGVGTMRDELCGALETRFHSINEDENYVIATVTDPRFKSKFAGPKGQDLLMAKISELPAVPGSSAESNVEVQPPPEKRARKDNHDDLWACFDEIVMGASEQSTLAIDHEREVSSFLALPLLPMKQCPYQWWATNRSSYPNIFCIVKRYLTAPSSSVYSERLFSEAGNISEAKRNRLNPHKSESLLLLHHNLPRLKFQY